VTVAAASDIDVRSLDRGRLRHPLYGNRRHWYDQKVTPGWFTKTLQRQAERVRRELIGVLTDISKKL
jgi:hypothetical protein